jgi:DNA mismatch endonuclease, patch repair protein
VHKLPQMSEKTKYIRDGRAPIPAKELTSKTMSAIKSRNTKPELIVRKALWRNGIRGYRLHWKNAPGRPDIAFPGKKIAVFINGCFWHRCPFCKPRIPVSHSDFWTEKFNQNIKRDLNKIILLNQKGWTSITIWECQLNENILIYVNKIREMLI